MARSFNPKQLAKVSASRRDMRERVFALPAAHANAWNGLLRICDYLTGIRATVSFW
jgi:hypothetical protein